MNHLFQSMAMLHIILDSGNNRNRLVPLIGIQRGMLLKSKLSTQIGIQHLKTLQEIFPGKDACENMKRITILGIDMKDFNYSYLYIFYLHTLMITYYTQQPSFA